MDYKTDEGIERPCVYKKNYSISETQNQIKHYDFDSFTTIPFDIFELFLQPEGIDFLLHIPFEQFMKIFSLFSPAQKITFSKLALINLQNDCYYFFVIEEVYQINISILDAIIQTLPSHISDSKYFTLVYNIILKAIDHCLFDTRQFTAYIKSYIENTDVSNIAQKLLSRFLQIDENWEQLYFFYLQCKTKGVNDDSDLHHVFLDYIASNTACLSKTAQQILLYIVDPQNLDQKDLAILMAQTQEINEDLILIFLCNDSISFGMKHLSILAAHNLVICYNEVLQKTNKQQEMNTSSIVFNFKKTYAELLIALCRKAVNNEMYEECVYICSILLFLITNGCVEIEILPIDLILSYLEEDENELEIKQELKQLLCSETES